MAACPSNLRLSPKMAALESTLVYPQCPIHEATWMNRIHLIQKRSLSVLGHQPTWCISRAPLVQFVHRLVCLTTYSLRFPHLELLPKCLHGKNRTNVVSSLLNRPSFAKVFHHISTFVLKLFFVFPRFSLYAIPLHSSRLGILAVPHFKVSSLFVEPTIVSGVWSTQLNRHRISTRQDIGKWVAWNPKRLRFRLQTYKGPWYINMQCLTLSQDVLSLFT